MECVRQIVDSELLDKLQLPRHMRNCKVEVIVFPVDGAGEDPDDEEYAIDGIIGILSEYANPDLIPLEKEAWGMAVTEKYADR